MKFLSATNEPVVLPIWSKRPHKLSTSTRKKSHTDNNYCKSVEPWRKTSVFKTVLKTLITDTSCDKSGYNPKIQTAYLESNCNRYIFVCMMMLLNLFMSISVVVATDIPATTPMQSHHVFKTSDSLPNEQLAHWMHINETRHMKNTTWQNDSIFMRLKQQITSGNELWDGIIRDCYRQPTFTCFQKNVYLYLNDALSAQDVNITQSFKFYKNNVELSRVTPTESALSEDLNEDLYNGSLEKQDVDEHLLENEIPTARDFPAETPIEEVTNALYDKSVKFAMTHDVEIQMPEIMFDGATFRISPKSFEGNGVIAKLELIPKQQVEARLAGKIIMKKIRKKYENKTYYRNA